MDLQRIVDDNDLCSAKNNALTQVLEVDVISLDLLCEEQVQLSLDALAFLEGGKVRLTQHDLKTNRTFVVCTSASQRRANSQVPATPPVRAPHDPFPAPPHMCVFLPLLCAPLIAHPPASLPTPPAESPLPLVHLRCAPCTCELILCSCSFSMRMRSASMMLGMAAMSPSTDPVTELSCSRISLDRFSFSVKFVSVCNGGDQMNLRSITLGRTS